MAELEPAIDCSSTQAENAREASAVAVILARVFMVSLVSV
jgi:hypothetical protein